MIVADALSNWIALSFHLLVADASSTVTLSTRKIYLVNCFLIGFSALFSVPLPEKRIFSPPFEAVFPFDIFPPWGFINGNQVRVFRERRSK